MRALVALLVLALAGFGWAAPRPQLPTALDPVVGALLGREPVDVQHLADALAAADCAQACSLCNLALAQGTHYGGDGVRRRRLAVDGRTLVDRVDDRVPAKFENVGVQEGRKGAKPRQVANVDGRAEVKALEAAVVARVRLAAALEASSPRLLVAEAFPVRPLLALMTLHPMWSGSGRHPLVGVTVPPDGLLLVGGSERFTGILRTCGVTRAPMLFARDVPSLRKALAALQLQAEVAAANVEHAHQVGYAFRQVDITRAGARAVSMRGGDFAKVSGLPFQYSALTLLDDVKGYVSARADLRTVCRALERLGARATLPPDRTDALVARAREVAPRLPLQGSSEGVPTAPMLDELSIPSKR